MLWMSMHHSILCFKNFLLIVLDPVPTPPPGILPASSRRESCFFSGFAELISLWPIPDHTRSHLSAWIWIFMSCLLPRTPGWGVNGSERKEEAVRWQWSIHEGKRKMAERGGEGGWGPVRATWKLGRGAAGSPEVCHGTHHQQLCLGTWGTGKSPDQVRVAENDQGDDEAHMQWVMIQSFSLEIL